MWQYYRDQQALANGVIADFEGNKNSSAIFDFKQKVTGITEAYGTKDDEIIVPLKCLSNFWGTLKMSLINCEIILFWLGPINVCSLNPQLK